MGIVEMRRRLMMAASNRDAQMARETVAAANSYGWQRDVAAVLAEMSSRDAAFVRSASASRTTSRSHGGGGDASRVWSTAAHNAYPRYPRTAEHMKIAAAGFGTWSAGWLCDEVTGSLVPVFGSPTLTVGAGTPTYDLPGFRAPSDRAVGFTDNTLTYWTGGNVYGLTGTDDLCVAFVVKVSAVSGAFDTAIVSKIAATATGGWFITGAASGADGFWRLLGYSTAGALQFFAPISTPMPLNEWTVVMACLDRGAVAANIASRGINSGAAATSGAAAAATATMASADPFTIGSAPGLLNGVWGGMQIAAVYVGSGASAAANMSANIQTAAATFAGTLRS